MFSLFQHFEYLRKFEICSSICSVLRFLHSLSSNPGSTDFTNLPTLLQGRISRPHLLQIHAHIIQVGAHQDNLIATRLIGHYPSHIALRVFLQLQHPNIFPFNAIMRVLAEEGHFLYAFSMFKNLKQQPLLPNDLTFSFLLKACSWSKDANYVQQIHTQIQKVGFLSNSFVANGLVAIYAKGFHNLISARKVFEEISEKRAISCWTSLIAGCVRSGQSEEALELFYQMVQRNLHPENDTMVSVLSACSNLEIAKIEMWVTILSEFVDNIGSKEICCDPVNTVLIYLYSKWGRVEKSREKFDQVSTTGKREVLPCNAMINAYVQNGCPVECLNLFRVMVDEQICRPNHVTMVSVLSACSQIGDLDFGRWVHEYMISIGQRGIIMSNKILATALIDMYSKCGNLEAAKEVFEFTVTKDVVLFNAMIMGLAINGEGGDALKLFSKMPEFDLRPNAGTYLSVLCACSHSGLLERGQQIFRDMAFSTSPKLEHYSCYIDLLARGGRVEEALDVVTSMPFNPNNFVWGALLGGCLLHSRIELAQEISKRLVQVDPHSSAGYVMLANVSASGCQWSDVSALRMEMREKGIRKQPGCSWISVNGVVHEFLVDCLSHPQIESIYQTMTRLVKHMNVSSDYGPTVLSLDML